MSKKIYCKDCRFYETGFCHRIPPVRVPGCSGSYFPFVNDFYWCDEADEKEEEDDSCNSESPEYQHQVKIKTLEDKIEFLKDTQRVIIQSLKYDCREFSTSGNCRMYHHGCDTNCLIHHIIMKYNIP
jgi:hypothetical protein